jgi:outer membrane biogenesis lipoprotein LolB
MEDQQKFHDLLREHMQRISQRKAAFTAGSHVLLSFLTAPMFTLSASLQMSVDKNAVTMQEFKSTDHNIRSFHERMGQLGSKTNQTQASGRFVFLELFKSQKDAQGEQLSRA